jgi:transcriptional regulator with XRE-family HTH domain
MGLPRRRFAHLRTTAGFSQERLAEAIGVDRTTISRWESGKSRPQPWQRPKLAELLHLTLGELEDLLNATTATGTTAEDRADRSDGPRSSGKADAPANSDPARVTSDAMRRRTILTWSMTNAAAAGVGGVDGQPIGRVGTDDARQLQTAAVRLYSLDYRHGGHGLWQAAATRAANGLALLEHGSYTNSVERDLVGATGRMQMCAGWLAFDAGEQGVARSCYTDALALARQGGDAEVETHALANLAFQSNVLRRPREALRLATAAERAAAAPGTPARLAAIPQLRKAIAAAMVRDRRETDQAVGVAREVLDRDADRDAEEWCAFLTPAELDGIEGTCAIELGRASTAIVLLERAVAAYGKRYARNRALFRVRLARAHLESSAPDGAAEAAGGALDDLADDVMSWRVSNELDAVARRLTPFASVPAVSAFLARHHALTK